MRARSLSSYRARTGIRTPRKRRRRSSSQSPCSDAAGGHVAGIIGDCDPFLAVKQALERERFDEVIVSTLPEHVSHWLRRDLPHRIKQLGVPVAVVTAKRSERPISDST